MGNGGNKYSVPADSLPAKYWPCSLTVHPNGDINQSCAGYSFRGWFKVFYCASKIYGPLFFISSLIHKRRITPESLYKVLLSVCRSSSFLATFASGYTILNCATRTITKANYPKQVFVAGFISSFISILIETPARRRELAVYVTNQAAEALYNCLRVRGLVKPIKYGDCFLFSVMFGFLVYFHKHEQQCLGNLKDPLRIILGNEHQPSWGYQKFRSFVEAVYPSGKELVTENKLCDHSDTCKRYFLICLLRCFTSAYIISQAVNLISGIMSGNLRENPFAFLTTKLLNFNFALFGGLLGSLPNGIICLWRHISGRKNDRLASYVAGFLAGLSVIFFRNTEMIMFFSAKAGEALFTAGVNRGWLKPIPMGDVLMYSISTTILFYCAVIEYYNLRPSYWQFLLRVTGGKDGMVSHFPIVGRELRRNFNIPTPVKFR
eukprot:TRINITY_DN5620_c0_g1_i1.p1 TRINITY_DN5620_c0_g1~~TRINITY_DN5620_c0_g1_i1.p1  ORF type:complete len:434 (-),score=37.38 TRINITY_DN5620_c0_g1_i1:66-1367(-)